SVRWNVLPRFSLHLVISSLFVSPLTDHPPHGDPEAQKPFRKMQQQQEEESLSSSSDLTVAVSEDGLILESPEPQPNPSDKMEGEDGIEALKLIHSEQERGALSTEKHNCILQTLSSPDSKKESSTNSPTRELYNHSDILKEDLEACGTAVLHQPPRLLPGGGSHEKQVRSEQASASGLLRAQLGQHMATLKERDNSITEEVAKKSEVFLVTNVDQRTGIQDDWAHKIGAFLSVETDRLEQERWRSGNETGHSGPACVLTTERWQIKEVTLFFTPVFLDRFWKQMQYSGPCRQLELRHYGSQ
ncbi:centrosomal protein kizuna-like, partial [Diceros bicornis minor]|uniref:centrosomal protein kizuna-like n=1 Tax=Diceros bicornis minor TaxID=77932 RepID=UPI0026EEF2AA